MTHNENPWKLSGGWGLGHPASPLASQPIIQKDSGSARSPSTADPCRTIPVIHAPVVNGRASLSTWFAAITLDVNYVGDSIHEAMHRYFAKHTVIAPATTGRLKAAHLPAHVFSQDKILTEFRKMEFRNLSDSYAAANMLHICPSQTADEFARNSELADPSGWIYVDPATLRNKTFENVHGLGDATNTPNAKTAAAARKQAPVVVENLPHALGKGGSNVVYDGYGSPPLTVEKGKIVLAEFAYGGKVCASFPKWLLDGTRPSRAARILKKSILPTLYWDAMLKGREWMAKPEAAA